MLVRLMIELALTLCRDSYYNMLRFYIYGYADC